MAWRTMAGDVDTSKQSSQPGMFSGLANWWNKNINTGSTVNRTGFRTMAGGTNTSITAPPAPAPQVSNPPSGSLYNTPVENLSRIEVAPPAASTAQVKFPRQGFRGVTRPSAVSVAPSVPAVPSNPLAGIELIQGGNRQTIGQTPIAPTGLSMQEVMRNAGDSSYRPVLTYSDTPEGMQLRRNLTDQLTSALNMANDPYAAGTTHWSNPKANLLARQNAVNLAESLGRNLVQSITADEQEQMKKYGTDIMAHEANVKAGVEAQTEAMKNATFAQNEAAKRGLEAKELAAKIPLFKAQAAHLGAMGGAAKQANQIELAKMKLAASKYGDTGLAAESLKELGILPTPGAVQAFNSGYRYVAPVKGVTSKLPWKANTPSIPGHMVPPDWTPTGKFSTDGQPVYMDKSGGYHTPDIYGRR